MQLLIWKSNPHDAPFIIHLCGGRKKSEDERTENEVWNFKKMRQSADLWTTETEKSSDLNTNRWEGDAVQYRVPERSVSTERAELWFCLISSRAEQVAQIRKRLLQNNNQKIGKSEWSEWWMNGGVITHHTADRQNHLTQWRRVCVSFSYQNHDWPSRTSPIRILNLIRLFLPEPNHYYPSEKAQLCSFPLISRTFLDLSRRMIWAASWRKWLSSWSHFILVPEKSIWLPSNIWQHHFFPSSLPKRVGRTYCRERLTSNWRLSERLMYFCVSKLRSHQAETCCFLRERGRPHLHFLSYRSHKLQWVWRLQHDSSPRSSEQCLKQIRSQKEQNIQFLVNNYTIKRSDAPFSSIIVMVRLHQQ